MQPAVNKFEVKQQTSTDTYIEKRPNGTSTTSTNTVSSKKSARYHYKPASVGVPIVNGWRAPTSWEHESGSWNMEGSFQATFSSGGYKWETTRAPMGDAIVPSSPFEFYRRVMPFPPSLTNRANQDALNNLKDQNIDLGEFIGEFRQTVGLVTDTANTIRKQVLRFKKRFPKDWKRIKSLRRGNRCQSCSKSAANKWLEYIYGWKPLISDVYGALDELDRTYREVGMVARVKGKALESATQDHHTVTSAFQGGMLTFPVAQRFDFESKTVLWYKMTNPHVALLSTIGLINPALIAWNLTRYSFVADWFLPIGSWLESFTADAGWDFISGTNSSKTVVEEMTNVPSGPPGWSISDIPHGNGSAELYRRSVINSSPVGGFYVKNPLGATKAITAISLLVQAFSK